MSDLDDDFVHLARFALAGQRDNVVALLRRVQRSLANRRPDLGKQMSVLLEPTERGGARAILRGRTPDPLPVDSDTRLELLRRENQVELLVEPVWDPSVRQPLTQILEERQRSDALAEAGLAPSRSALFVGPPGVGKTLAARWLAHELDLPLMTLDLAAVMSSFLGRTGNNVRVVLDYARRSPAVLLLDEFDAIAKRRDDTSEVGELKRLVTVLLQAVDDWPAAGLLIAATNHSELLDPAVWRRFDRLVEFPKPNVPDAAVLIAKLAGIADGAVAQMLACMLVGCSHAEIARTVGSIRRQAVLRNADVTQLLLEAAAERSKQADVEHRLEIAHALKAIGQSQRKISQLTGLSRDTIRKHATEE